MLTLPTTSHAVADFFEGDFSEDAFSDWVKRLRSRLSWPEASLGLVFLSPDQFERSENILEIIRLQAKVLVLAGCSSTSLIGGDEERENQPGIALGLYHLPGARITALHFTQKQVEEANGPAYWRMETGVEEDQTNGWLVFADPFHLNGETWLRQWNEAYLKIPILGGLATGAPGEELTQIYLNGQVHETGGVALSFEGKVRLASVISQGCTPIGETWTITRAQENLILEIGNRRAYDVLFDTLKNLPIDEQLKSRGNLFVGLVVNEYLEEFRRGDFLIRNLLGVDPQTGSIAIGASPRVGQTLQFQRRDAATGTEDMESLLARIRSELGTAPIYGACLCCCNGRGQGMFGKPGHDAGQVQKILGPLGMAGFFCNGEIGPIGDRNFLHGYTASLALFVGKE